MPSFCLCQCCSSFLLVPARDCVPSWKTSTLCHLLCITHFYQEPSPPSHLSLDWIPFHSLSLSLPLLLLLLHLHGADQRSLLYSVKATPVRGLVSSCLDGWVIPTAPVPAGDRQTFSDCGHRSPMWIGSTDRPRPFFVALRRCPTCAAWRRVKGAGVKKGMGKRDGMNPRSSLLGLKMKPLAECQKIKRKQVTLPEVRC